MEIEIQFTDRTLLETNGEYKQVCKVMKDEEDKTGVVSKKGDWMLRSRMTIMSPFGFANLTCHFYSTGKVYIAEYLPSQKDVHNSDIHFLTRWCNSSGWQTPEPLPVVAESWLEFWRKEWETYMVDSAHFENKYGPRQDLQFDDSNSGDDDGDRDQEDE